MEIIKLKIYGKLHKNQNFTEDQINLSYERMESALAAFEGILSRNGNYVCGGNAPSISDFLFFFELTNYMYYDKTWAHHKLVD